MLVHNERCSPALSRVKQVQWARTIFLPLGHLQALATSITCSVIGLFCGSKCRRDVDQEVSRTSGL